MAILIVTLISLSIYYLAKIVMKYRRIFSRDRNKFFHALNKSAERDYIKNKVLHKQLVFVNKPQLIQKVLKSDVCLDKPHFFFKLFGADDSLLASKCEIWDFQKKIVLSSRKKVATKTNFSI